MVLVECKLTCCLCVEPNHEVSLTLTTVLWAPEHNHKNFINTLITAGTASDILAEIKYFIFIYLHSVSTYLKLAKYRNLQDRAYPVTSPRAVSQN